MLETMRQWGTTCLQYGEQRWQRWRKDHHQLLHWGRKAYILLAWILIPLALLAWIFIPQARQALVQFLWSYYLLWQFWFLARSKTMTWTGTARFFAVGAWLTAPLSALILYFIHGLFAQGALSVGADWSSEVLGPFIEETVKLIPFFLLFLWTRRTQHFSLTDYLLAGAAVGVGFDFMEEMLRRWVTADSGSGFWGFLSELLSDTEQNWEIFTLFPGSFESSHAFSSGHGIWSGFVTLAIGLGIHLQKQWGKKAFFLPLAVFSWAVFDHGAWNAHSDGMPLLAELLYGLTGQGHFLKWVFVAAFLGAIGLDYLRLNQVRERLPRLPGEHRLEPLTELLTILQTIPRGRQVWGHMLLFTRERRRLGFTLLAPPEAHRGTEQETLHQTLHRRFLILGSALAVGLLFLGLSTDVWILSDSPEAYFTGLLDRLADWWQGLNGWEKAGVITAVTALGGILTVATGGGFLAGGFTALGAALTANDILQNPESTKAFLKDPVGTLKQWGKELLRRPPQEAGVLMLAVAADQLARRVPVLRVVDELIHRGKTTLQRWARRWMPGHSMQEAGTGARVDWNEPDVRQAHGSGASNGPGGEGKEPEKKKTGWERFEEEDPLPGSLGTSKTKSLFTQVQKMAYKDNPRKYTKFGIPDDIVVKDGRITIVEEAKMYSKKDFEQLAKLAEKNPNKFVEEGIPAETHNRQTRYIQFKKHKQSLNYLLNNFEKISSAKELGITHSDAKVEYMLKVPKWASEDALEKMKKAFEEQLHITVKYRRIDWGG
ncbi:PrsW family intramembrane metalloprotease [Kroppenstedtia eburnea]|uniref:PrsW family intramembrane metalloprotease n=1 Tax=Kroppenstedtia eburnea TaxID=714067 RepID=UPI00362B914B